MLLTNKTEAQEKLFDLYDNPVISSKTFKPSSRSSNKKYKNPYYLIDTISLPFIDDFSSNKLLNSDFNSYPEQAIADSIAYYFLVNGMSVDSIALMTDTSYSYTFNNLTNKYDSVANTAFIITKFENYQEPFSPTSSFKAWPTYAKPVFDSLGIFQKYEQVPPDVILKQYTDTIKVVNTKFSGNLWTDNNVYINDTYPVKPISIGVATFDGLMSDGKPYMPNQTQSQGAADTLTSKPIDLNYLPSDSLYFSFYYQAQGIGNAPEKEDMLILEFFSPIDQIWYLKWSAEGTAVEEFKQVLIPITEDLFLRKGFKFRFVNFATLSGNLDHWHIDYVKLSTNRTINDSLPNDVAFTKKPPVLLDKYQEMPWKQYVANPQGEMQQNLQVDMRNNSPESKVVTYTYNINDKQNKLLITNGGLNGNEKPNSSFIYSNKLDFYFPSSNNNFETFEILNTIVVPVVGDEVKQNDTVRHIQKFDHSFAYDDGTAEAAYGINTNGAKLAYSFALNTPDTLTAIAIHFAQINKDVSYYSFKLAVWNNLSPENLIYQSEDFENPVYTGRINGYYVYKIKPLALPAGIFYVGLIQTSAEKLNIGFDKNNNASNQMRYNTDGIWENTQFNGSWMIRPILGTPVLPVGISINNSIFEKDSELANKIEVWPNPCRDQISITGLKNKLNYQIEIIDLLGNSLKKSILNTNKNLNLSDLKNGIYLIQITDSETLLTTSKKIIITR